MNELLVQALTALTFANDLLGKPYEHQSEEMADGHYHLIETIENIRKELNKDTIDVSDSGC